METIEYQDVINKLNLILTEINTLKNEVNQNESLLIKLLEVNNKHTKKIYDVTIQDKSSEQQLKDFGMNILANIAGNAVTVPQLINFK